MQSTVLILATIALVGLAGCSDHKKENAGPPAVLVQTAVSTQATVPNILEVFGTIAAINSVDIIPQVSGTLVKTHFEYGALVQENDPLFTIDQRPYIANLIKAKADLESKRSAAKVALDKAQRSAALVPKNYISVQDFENLVAQANIAEQDVIAAEAEVLIAEVNLGYTELNAPFKGLTGVKLFSDGDLLTANSSMILTLNQIDPIQVNFFIPCTQFSQVQEAFNKNNGKLPIHVQLLETPGAPIITGETSFFNNMISSSTGTIELQGVLPNTQQQLWAGQYVNVRLQLSMLENATLVPEAAVAIGPEGPYVFVIKPDNTADLRLVKIGNTIDQQTIILEGVKAGETVVTLGQLKLRPGIEVKVQNKTST